MKRSIVIVGGGIAGLASARALAQNRGFEVTLLERESTLCEHASGHNAAIFRPLEEEAGLARLARESLAAFRELVPSDTLLDARGFVLLHRDPARLTRVQQGALAGGVESRLLEPGELGKLLPDRPPPREYYGLFTKSGGVIDIHALAQSLALATRALGARILTGVEVKRVVTRSGRVCGVQTSQAGELSADAVVIAGGAWSRQLSAELGCPLELRAVRRHLALLEPERPLEPEHPVVWCLEPEVYFRAELDRVLASPCDATVVDGTVAQPEIAQLSSLWEKLAHLETGLQTARVSHHWACLRTFAPDDRPIIGPDPRLVGLYWLAGLGGFGMTTGVAAGQELARTLSEERESDRFSVQRLLSDEVR